ncbi:UDP-N-acetylenolpyruvoylglucosamine reductase [anaerobic digester metagenome]
MKDILARRVAKQPLEYPSAGSTFKRPQNGFAAALIEECGLKGLSAGGAQVSTKHAGFVINTGGATCRDVLALIEAVKNEVCRRTGVLLEPEIKYLT